MNISPINQNQSHQQNFGMVKFIGKTSREAFDTRDAFYKAVEAHVTIKPFDEMIQIMDLLSRAFNSTKELVEIGRWGDKMQNLAMKLTNSTHEFGPYTNGNHPELFRNDVIEILERELAPQPDKMRVLSDVCYDNSCLDVTDKNLFA